MENITIEKVIGEFVINIGKTTEMWSLHNIKTFGVFNLILIFTKISTLDPKLLKGSKPKNKGFLPHENLRGVFFILIFFFLNIKFGSYITLCYTL